MTPFVHPFAVGVARERRNAAPKKKSSNAIPRRRDDRRPPGNPPARPRPVQSVDRWSRPRHGSTPARKPLSTVDTMWTPRSKTKKAALRRPLRNFLIFLMEFGAGEGDSNPRPQPWQGHAATRRDPTQLPIAAISCQCQRPQVRVRFRDKGVSPHQPRVLQRLEIRQVAQRLELEFRQEFRRCDVSVRGDRSSAFPPPRSKRSSLKPSASCPQTVPPRKPTFATGLIASRSAARGFCVKRLTDLTMLWSEQWRAIGLQEPVQAQVEPS